MSTLLHALRSSPRPRAPRWLLERPIAHRGLHDPLRPENTMAAFEAAAQAGYPIELDVHASRDGEVMVFHDDTLDRLTSAHGPVGHRTAAELGALPIGGTTETIPTLAAVLERIDRRVPVVVEIKNDGAAGPLEQAVADVLRRHPGRYTVQSFNPWTLLWFRRHAPYLPRGMLASDFAEEDLPRHHKTILRNLLLAPRIGPSYVGYALDNLPYWAPSLLRRMGVPLLAWTIRSAEDLRRARRLADNVIFEHVRP